MVLSITMRRASSPRSWDHAVKYVMDMSAAVLGWGDAGKGLVSDYCMPLVPVLGFLGSASARARDIADQQHSSNSQRYQRRRHALAG